MPLYAGHIGREDVVQLIGRAIPTRRNGAVSGSKGKADSHVSVPIQLDEGVCGVTVFAQRAESYNTCSAFPVTARRLLVKTSRILSRWTKLAL